MPPQALERDRFIEMLLNVAANSALMASQEWDDSTRSDPAA